MSALVEAIKEHPQIFHSSRSKMVAVWDAEDKLELTFPEEYASYLCHFGAIGFGKVEWTGLNVDPELNVVRATRAARQQYPDFPKDCFVLRVLDAKGHMILCDSEEHIYACLNEEAGHTADGQKNLRRALVTDGLESYFRMCLAERTGE